MPAAAAAAVLLKPAPPPPSAVNTTGIAADNTGLFKVVLLFFYPVHIRLHGMAHKGLITPGSTVRPKNPAEKLLEENADDDDVCVISANCARQEKSLPRTSALGRRDAQTP